MSVKSILASGCLLVISLGLITMPAHADVNQAPDLSQATVLNVPTPFGDKAFLVVDSTANISQAWRNDEISSGEIEPGDPAAAYELTSRVIVRSANIPAQPRLGAIAGVVFEPLGVFEGFWLVEAATVAQAVELATQLSADPNLEEVYLDISMPKVLRGVPDDPEFWRQWHLENTDLLIADANLVPAWNAGHTGAGLIIGILEGGWQHDHPDLAANFSVEATQTGGGVTSHATSCAGVAGAVAFNGAGGGGAAYNAKLSDQLYGSFSQNAAAFEFRNDLNDIKNNSWGPYDNGTISYMSTLERTALETSVNTGRDGLGEIFVWAAGNGGLNDRIDYDPYASSRFTCAIGGIGDGDYRSYFNETGASMLAVAHTSGNSRYIYTTTSGSGYTTYFGGTSSASPLACGVIALILEANPLLSWRDVQHVLINSARICDPGHADWTTNAAGHDLNYHYGYGAVDAEAATTLAAQWIPVAPEVVYDSGLVLIDTGIPDNNTFGVFTNVDVTENIRVESVELLVHITTDYVGDLLITLSSPQGTQSVLAEDRIDATDDYYNYIFTSLRHWDEESAGPWTINIADLRPYNQAHWDYYRFKVYGTAILPGQPGDMNCDGEINSYDIDGFICAVSPNCDYEATYPDCARQLGDINGDGDVNAYDIDPFIDLISGGG
ncbi:MAG: S8 family serine peptidase [Planctomycetota bacterium]